MPYSMVSTVCQHRVHIVSTWRPHGSIMVSTWCQHGANMVSTWLHHGGNLVSTWRTIVNGRGLRCGSPLGFNMLANMAIWCQHGATDAFVGVWRGVDVCRCTSLCVLCVVCSYVYVIGGVWMCACTCMGAGVYVCGCVSKPTLCQRGVNVSTWRHIDST
jgi:hypothetical protein